MKRMRAVLGVVAIAVLAVAVLIWFLPASWGLPLLLPASQGLRLEQIAGTIWQGRAGKVINHDGMELGAAQWSLSRRALIGDTELALELSRPRLHVSGHMQRLSATVEAWRDVTLQMDASLLGSQPLLHGQPQGQFQAHVTEAQLQGGWPMQLQSSGTWSHAAIDAEGTVIPLGTLLFQLDSSAGVLQGSMRDDGSGPLQTAGRLSFSPLGWQLTIDLRPRSDTPGLRRWLQTLGKIDADGTVHLGYRGGLAQLAPTGTQ